MHILVLIGTLVVLWKLESTVRRRSAMRGADRVQQALRDVYAKERELVEARLEDFPHLDLGFYDSTTALLAQQGFRALCDVEDRTLLMNRHARRTFIRVFTDDRGVGVGIYNFQLAGWARWLAHPRHNRCIVEVESELSDGTYLSSSNAWNARHIERPPQFDTIFHPPVTGAEVLLAEHRARLREYLERRSDATPIVDHSFADVVASMQRSHRLKAGHRAKSGFVMSRDELRGIADDSRRAAMKKAANEIADAFDAGEIEASANPAHRLRELSANIVLWLLLVAVFVVVYGWTAR